MGHGMKLFPLGAGVGPENHVCPSGSQVMQTQAAWVHLVAGVAFRGPSSPVNTPALHRPVLDAEKLCWREKGLCKIRRMADGQQGGVGSLSHREGISVCSGGWRPCLMA